MQRSTPEPHAANVGLNGWVEAGLFAIALSVLNISYGVGYQIGAHPVAFLVYAMPIAAATLLHITGPGPDWLAVIRHPLSWVIGGGIIAMEATYYLLLNVLTPTDGSLLVRLNVPVAMGMGLLAFGRRPSLLSCAGALIVIGGVAWYVPQLDPSIRWTGLALGLGCAVIMNTRAFATEFHPWNRRAKTISEKMRVTGLVLGVTSLMGALLVFGLMTAVAYGIVPPLAGLPSPQHFLHLPTYLLGLFVGGFVLTAMQYLGFSVVVKIRTENFVATTALVPIVTLVLQIAAVALGILAPVPLDWQVVPAMLAVFAGVMLVIWGGRRSPVK